MLRFILLLVQHISWLPMIKKEKNDTFKSTYVFVLYFRPMSKAKESYTKANTLSCIVGLCVGHVTTIELRNDAHVTGKIISVDGFMNVTFEKSLLLRKSTTKMA